MPRQESDERTSVGRKCLRAKVLLPEPLGPIEDDEGEVGDGDFHQLNLSPRNPSRDTAAMSGHSG